MHAVPPRCVDEFEIMKANGMMIDNVADRTCCNCAEMTRILDVPICARSSRR